MNTEFKKGPWAFKDDWFLAEHYPAVGSFIGPHDLGRSEEATEKRVEKLKSCGAWLHMQVSILHREQYALSLVESKKRPNEDEIWHIGGCVDQRAEYIASLHPRSQTQGV